MGVARQSNSISLPWSRRGGVLVAELGAVFTVELAEEGWQCSVENGECVEVLGTGLKSQRQGKARAEEHATRMAAEALAEKAPKGRARRMPPGRKPAGRLAAAPEKPAEKPEDAPGPAPKPRGGAPRPADAKPADAKPADAKPADAKTSEITFDEIEDGCIMGRVAGACWVANEKEVAWTKDVGPELQAAVEKTAARYYREKREAKAAERAAARDQREVAKKAAREKKQAAAAKKRAAKEAAKATPAKKAAKATAKKVARKTATEAEKPTAKKTAKTAAKTVAAAKTPASESAASPKTVGRTAKKGPRGRKGKAVGKAEAKEEEVVTVKTTEKQTKGPIAWTNQDGGLRGTAAHGTFLVQPEGSRHALYFYEPGGQSRFLQSGTICDMRKAAEEMAARGQPAPSSEKISPEMEAQMMQMFVTGAVGGNPA